MKTNKLAVLIFALIAMGIQVSAKSAPKASAKAPVKVKTYVKKDGAVVQTHQRTAPDNTQKDNWSAKGNVNPVTGKPGTKPVKK